MVESSVGHVRDLPHSAAEVPAAQKQEPWARLGVNVDSDFEPLYVVDPKKKCVVSELRSKLKSADELLLATDEDREGEAIAWHLVQVLKPKVPVRRMVFHEITKSAIEQALDETREIDDGLVDAQETRRILDRLYGYEVSPVLWKKVMKGLSAGRVQSVATRLVVERERERIEFRAAEYWDLVGSFDPGGFEARLTGVDGERVATGRDFARTGELITRRWCSSTRRPRGARASARGRRLRVSLGRAQADTRRPAAPFMTSTLQQEASRKLRFSAQHRCASRSACTRAATSPICAPTRPRCRRPRSPPRATRPAGSTARRSSPPSRGATTARSRTPRRRTRRSAPPATASVHPTRCAASSRARRRRCTTWSGSGRSPRRWPTRAARPCRCGSARLPAPQASPITWSSSARRAP